MVRSQIEIIASAKLFGKKVSELFDDVEIEPIATTPSEFNSPDLGSIASYIAKESLLVYKEDF